MDTGLVIGAIAVGLTAVTIVSNAIQFRSKAAVDTVTILKSAVDTLRQEVTDLKGKLEECHSDCEKLRHQIITDNSETLRLQLNQALARYTTLQEQYRLLRDELAAVMRQVTKLGDPAADILPDG
jgi:chromosome segregation ATPase